MFELAADYARHSTNFELIGGYFSPVSDAYKKEGLALAVHRLNMVKRACETSDKWDVDEWEAMRTAYTPTAAVLDHFNYEINTLRHGIDVQTPGQGSRNATTISNSSLPLTNGTDTVNGYRGKRKVKIMLLAGSDLLKTMSDEGVWDAKDLNHILGDYGVFIIERMGADIKKATSALSAWSNNIHQVGQTVLNDVSSTKIRLLLRKEYSVRYLLPEGVVDYIEENGLYSRSFLNARVNEGGENASDNGSIASSTATSGVATPLPATATATAPATPAWERLYHGCN